MVCHTHNSDNASQVYLQKIKYYKLLCADFLSQIYFFSWAGQSGMEHFFCYNRTFPYSKISYYQLQIKKLSTLIIYNFSDCMYVAMGQGHIHVIPLGTNLDQQSIRFPTIFYYDFYHPLYISEKKLFYL